MIICYTVPDIWYVTDVIVVSFHVGLFLLFYPPPPPLTSIEKSSFYTCVTKIMDRWCMVTQIRCATDEWMDGRTDGRKKWHIEVGTPPKKCCRKKILNLWNLPVNWGTKPVLESHWQNHWKWLAPGPVSVSWILCQTERVFDCFTLPNIIHKVKKKMARVNFNLNKVWKMPSLKTSIYLMSWRS